MTHSIPPSTCRSSRLGRPWPGFCLGNSALTRSHCSSARRPASSVRRVGAVGALSFAGLGERVGLTSPYYEAHAQVA